VPEDRPAGRRFAPSPKNVTEGGIVYGVWVANNRTRLELTQRELAARISVSPSTIQLIEQGHPAGAEIREKLAAIFSFDRPSLAHRVVTKIPPRGPMRRPRTSLGSRSLIRDACRALGVSEKVTSRTLWVGAAAVAIAVLALAVSAISGSGGSASSMQRPVAVSQVLAPPVAIHQARVQALRRAAAEARAAERRREREAAAAANAAAAAAKKAAAKAARQKASAAPEPVNVASSPAPSTGGGGGSGSSGPAPSPAPSTGGGGGSGSSGPAPDLQHGIGPEGG
jgi:transcriptional regulator with XRE-family HTH domain